MIVGFLIVFCSDLFVGGYCWLIFDWLFDLFVLLLVLLLEFVLWVGWFDVWFVFVDDFGCVGWLIFVVVCGWLLVLLIVDVFWLDVFVFVWLFVFEFDWLFVIIVLFVFDFISEGLL